jgi:hypothetical protein
MLAAGRHYVLLGDVEAFFKKTEAGRPVAIVVTGFPATMSRAIARSLADVAKAELLEAPEDGVGAWLAGRAAGRIARAGRTGGQVVVCGSTVMSFLDSCILPPGTPSVIVDGGRELAPEIASMSAYEKAVRVKAFARAKGLGHP